MAPPTPRPVRVFLSAGDVSGDQHGAALARELRARAPGIELLGMGGPAMEAAGCRLACRLTDHAVLGFSRVLKALPTFMGLLERAAVCLDAERPDACVLIDFPGFNLNLAALAHRRGIPVIYYICPQLWAWASWRLRRFARRVDLALVIFPFEEEFFRDHGVAATWVGHPAADAIAAAGTAVRTPHERSGLCLLPGSRTQEVAANLPLMLEVAARLRAGQPDLEVACAHLDERMRLLVAELSRQGPLDPPLRILADYHAAIRGARLALVASGTATLEVALLGTPMVVVYRIGRWLRWASRHLLTVPHIAQVNLVAGRRIVPEFLTSGRDIPAIAEAAANLFTESSARRECLEALAALEQRVGAPGAAGKAAAAILERLQAGSKITLRETSP
ncbi:MAG: lipid-A-disaccharide synthase [Planctomycetota bacterium]